MPVFHLPFLLQGRHVLIPEALKLFPLGPAAWEYRVFWLKGYSSIRQEKRMLCKLFQVCIQSLNIFCLPRSSFQFSWMNWSFQPNQSLGRQLHLFSSLLIKSFQLPKVVCMVPEVIHFFLRYLWGRRAVCLPTLTEHLLGIVSAILDPGGFGKWESYLSFLK